ncbi:energy transducer TonB [Methylophilus aquaticus]|uniref:Protein TonB n=1 Tax=Methylophilus aquaticus TaxID=1971610 RepID=A0ABT9JSD5_9PROT|nr:TonB family protein [Methylophilus aquaticus]MDP8567469.1 TonB family protein [Methylophilus aquaticus]
MQAVLQPSKKFKHLLLWCLIGSVLAHIVMMFAISKPAYEVKHAPKQEIRIELVKQEVPQPEAIQQEAPPPPKPVPVKPRPTPTELKPAVPRKPSPLPELPAEHRPQPTVEPPTLPSPVIAVKPTVSDSKPETVTAPAPPAPPPAPEPVKVSGPSEGDIEAARNAFRNAAHRELKKNQRYPRISQDRGIEGEVKLSINLDDHGSITSIEVLESSGNKPIDEAAISAAQKAQLKQYFNEILRGRINNIIVTVSFKLTS